MDSYPPPSLPPHYYAEDRGGKLIGIACAFAVLTTMVVSLQFYAKRYSAPRFDAYDFFLIIGYLLNLVACAMAIASTHIGGIGRHIEAVERDTPWQVRGWAISIFAFEMGYFVSVAFPKIAIICLYLRIFKWTGAKRFLAMLLIFLNASLALSLVIVACFQCRPLAYWWDEDIEGGTCIDIQTFYHAQALPGLVLDLGILALPLQSIWRMNLPFFRKVALGMIFLVGSFGIVAAVVRTTVFFSTEALDDRTMASVDLECWSIIETSMYIVAVCMPRLPPLRPLVGEMVPNRLRVICRRTAARVSAAMSQGSRAVSMASRRTAQGFGWVRKGSSSVALSRHDSMSPKHAHTVAGSDAAGDEFERRGRRRGDARLQQQTWHGGEEQADEMGGPYRRQSLPAIGSLERIDVGQQEAKEAKAGQAPGLQQQSHTPRESGSSRLPRSPRSAIFVTCREPSPGTSPGSSGLRDAKEKISIDDESEVEELSKAGSSSWEKNNT